MADKKMSKQEWVALFKEIGLDQATMHKWHAAFEKRHPDAHQSFLEWLSIPPKEIADIREHSRKG